MYGTAFKYSQIINIKMLYLKWFDTKFSTLVSQPLAHTIMIRIKLWDWRMLKTKSSPQKGGHSFPTEPSLCDMIHSLGPFIRSSCNM